MEQHELLIRQCLEGNPADAQNTFNSLMLSKLSDAIDNRRQEYVSSIFTPVDVTGTE